MVKTASERKKILVHKRLCFNCARPSHRASDCTSKITCQNCSRKHHTSICDTNPEEHREQMLGAHMSDDADVVFPVVLVEVGGITTRALLDTGAGGSYASAKLIKALHKQPVETKTKKIEMMIASTTTKVEIYNAEVKSIDGKFNMSVNFTKVHKPELLWVENPKYKELISKYPHLEGVHMDDDDTKSQLPIHLVLGAAEYSRIKTETRPRVGGEYEPVGELTKLGWVLMASGQEFDRDVMLLTQTSQADYDQLCRLDVLGLEHSAEHDQQTVFTEFKEQLRRNPEGWYETALPWKGNHAPLPTNKQNSLRRLGSLTRKLQRNNIAQEYDAIIQDQKETGVVESADQPAQGKEFYIPHKAVILESAETTKMRIVYDASARATPDAPSLNECLYPGPSLQNKLWDVLVRQRAYPVVITGDIQKAFLQIRIRESERDALRFHWRSEPSSKLETLRFTRALFGLAPSPFLLGVVIECHLDAWKEIYPEFVAELRRSLYVDDLLTGGQTIGQAKTCKEKATEILGDATFLLHKWNSNEQELEVDSEIPMDHDELTYAKQQCGVKPDESRLLGLLWRKKEDTMTVVFPHGNTVVTKRGVLSELAKIYDPLGLVAPLTLKGKLIYREICNAKTAWDADLNGPLRHQWIKWRESLPTEETVPRSIADHREPVLEWELHAFGDASTQGVGAATYSVVRQQAGTTQRLIAAKGRLAKQGLTIPRLELIAAHMATNLVINVRQALSNLPAPKIYAWLDSTVALHWILGHGEYRQFVQNRVRKIQQHPEITWRHVPTSNNPADLASRGGPVTDIALWWNGPEWLKYPDQWPPNPVLESTKASKAEARITREIFAGAIQTPPEADAFDQLLEAHDLRRALRVGAWIVRFAHNCKAQNRRKGALTTEELQNHTHWWILRVQKRSQHESNYANDKLQLNLQLDENGILECRGRIQGHFPIYLPDTAIYTEKSVQFAHEATLHGGVGLTMARVREKVWVPRLRRLAKRVIKRCWGCKRFQATALARPPPGNLPTDRTMGHTAFQVVGVDFAGPLRYRTRAKKEAKAYIVLYACSLSRALYLELLPTLETNEFLGSLKRLIARRGRPEKLYSDNGRTFVGAAKWMKTVMRDERFNNFLAHQDIQRQFNLSRAPWWGGQFEGMVGLMKTGLYKSFGSGFLTWNELQEVLLDVEVTLNNRPLSYVEDDVQMPTLTPNSLMFTQPNTLPELAAHHLDKGDLRKRARHLKRCKDAMWERWTKEYMCEAFGNVTT